MNSGNGMIDIPTLRKLGTDPSYAPPAVFANACTDAASAMEHLCKQIDGSVKVAAAALTANRTLVAALKDAVRIAEEARQEWDRAPNGMRAGKILIALAGGCPGYRADIDAIHAAIAAYE